VDTTGLNTQRKILGREQDSGETEREGGEAERCCKQVMALVINLTVRENIYDSCKRIVLNNQDDPG